MKKLFSILLIALGAMLVPSGLSYAQDPSEAPSSRKYVKMGTLIERDSLGRHTRKLSNHLIAPKGEIQMGTQVAYANLSSDDSELFLFLKDIDASASVFRITPFVGYTYSDNHAVGVRFAYTTMNGNLGNGVADLLNEGLEFGGELGLQTKMWGFSADVYHRTYVGLDNRGIVGLFWDIVLGYSLQKTIVGSSYGNYSFSNKAKLSFNPGIEVFPMNNVSLFVSLSLADVSFNNVKNYETTPSYKEAGSRNVSVTGTRSYWDGRCEIYMLDINLGLTFHL
ncbi:MAG: hypothetical protein MJY56_06195 [Bacteroidales bacterium]|nr:hypothetical protein [Bacteroidales bacterium]